MVVLSLALTACASRPISLATGPRSLTPEDYEDVYEAWTRSEEDFEWSTLSEVLRVTATFESWEFRWAYVVRYASDYALTGETRNALLRASLDDAQENHRFFITLAGDRFRDQDLSRPNSAWRVILVDPDGRQTEPVAVERVRRSTAAERTYFPTINVHRQAFRVVFPAAHSDGTPTIPPNTDTIRLRFAGALGRVDVVWRFESSGSSGGEESTASSPAPASTL